METARKAYERRDDAKDKRAKVEQRAALLTAERDLKQIDALLEYAEVQTEAGVRTRLAAAEDELTARRAELAGLVRRCARARPASKPPR